MVTLIWIARCAGADRPKRKELLILLWWQQAGRGFIANNLRLHNSDLVKTPIQQCPPLPVLPAFLRRRFLSAPPSFLSRHNNTHRPPLPWFWGKKTFGTGPALQRQPRSQIVLRYVFPTRISWLLGSYRYRLKQPPHAKKTDRAHGNYIEGKSITIDPVTD